MKVLFAILLVGVCANALPQALFENEFSTREERIVTNQIKRAIEQLRRDIKAAGLDPLLIEKYEGSTSPVPILVTIAGKIENLEFTGLSNIAINDLDYSTLRNRLRFDISLPQLSLSIGNSEVRANVFGNRYNGRLSGNLGITQIRVSGEVRVNVGIISGVSIRSVDAKFRIQNIKSALAVLFQGEDYSDTVNALLNETVPQLLDTYKEEIDKYLSDLIKEVGNDALGRTIMIENEDMIL
ncbi:uncharacterized protein LOC112057898 [Bicyclus anynana]|uniref:Uncharacterized protein LOC112057898 n=1 Tax=Bicyclus anynana TaxID=110368 RepID=A0ABM3LE90_BICAN|nr:uncharacterized protein LOC112057898 [Bicyclus anynana]